MTAGRQSLSLWQRLAYGSGNFASMTTGYGIVSLAPYVFTLGLGLNPALVGLALAAPRFVDLFTDPAVGILSDRVIGRVSRRAFVGWGSVFSAICFCLVWWFPHGMSERGNFLWLLGFSCATAVGWSLLSIPWQALGFELTSDYHERTQLMAAATVILGVAGIFYGWSYAAAKLSIFPDIITGARWVGTMMALSILVSGAVTGLFCNEPRAKPNQLRESVQGESVHPPRAKMAESFGRVFRSTPFLRVAGAVLLMCVGVFSVTGIGPYIAIYYVEHGDQAKGAVLIGLSSTAWQGTCLLFAGIVSKLSRRVGKSWALIVFLAIALLGNLAKWICYSPSLPWLVVIPSIMFAAGFTGLWTLAPAMVADVCEYEEMTSGFRDDGVFAAFYTWMIKLGSTIAFVAGGYLINLSGFRVEKGVDQGTETILRMRLVDFLVPAVTIGIAIYLLWKYPLSESRLQQKRAEGHP
jgi:GPH family glycoside/pentoside/hexuronide:cation symporter